jgi:hypothetical protein
MRAAALFIVVVLLASVCQASGPVVPVLTLTIAPSTQEVNSTATDPVIVSFNGTASVDKLPVERCVVTLTSAVDVGWQASITPTQMVFTSSTPQQFTATVTVPQGTASIVGTLMVNGRAVAAGLQSTTQVKAIINVHGVKILNQTASNQTGRHTASGTGASANFGGSTIVTVSITAVIVASIAVCGVVLYKKRKGRRMAPDA